MKKFRERPLLVTETLRSETVRRRRVSALQMVILHFEKLSSCFCGRVRRLKTCVSICRRCWTIREAKLEFRRTGRKWVRGVKSDAV